MKLWSGRFDKNTDALVDELNASIGFDNRMFREDITGSIAHAGMLGAQGIIDPGEAEKIIEALRGILKDMEEGKIAFNIARRGYPYVRGAGAHRAHRRHGQAPAHARSRNDQVALDIRLNMKKEIAEIRRELLDLIAVILDVAEKNTDAVMPAYTHLQRASPPTLPTI
jgi:argininosuccinate lyase